MFPAGCEPFGSPAALAAAIAAGPNAAQLCLLLAACGGALQGTADALARVTGSSRGTVYRTIDELDAAGLIEHAPLGRGQGLSIRLIETRRARTRALEDRIQELRTAIEARALLRPPMGATEPLRPPMGATEPLRPPMGATEPLRPPMGATEPLRPSMGATEPLRPPMGATEPLRPPMGATEPLRPPMGATEPLRPPMGATEPLRPPMGATEPLRPPMGATEPLRPPMGATEPLRPPMGATEPLRPPMGATHKEERASARGRAPARAPTGSTTPNDPVPYGGGGAVQAAATAADAALSAFEQAAQDVLGTTYALSRAQLAQVFRDCAAAALDPLLALKVARKRVDGRRGAGARVTNPRGLLLRTLRASDLDELRAEIEAAERDARRVAAREQSAAPAPDNTEAKRAAEAEQAGIVARLEALGPAAAWDLVRASLRAMAAQGTAHEKQLALDVLRDRAKSTDNAKDAREVALRGRVRPWVRRALDERAAG